MKTKMGNLIVGAMLAALCTMQYAEADWITIDAPGASRTYLYGTDGTNVVGHYFGASGSHAFLYDGTNWSPVDFPGAYLTSPMDIEGGKIVGTYDGWTTPHGFQYDGTTWGTIDFPGAPQTSIFGIDGGHIVGCHGLPGAYHGFVYDGIDWTSFDAPGASTTYAQGIDMDAGTGGIIVGFGQTGTDYGWLYDIDKKEFTPLYGPGGVLAYPFDIEGNNIIGSYRDGGAGDHGFLYDGTTWTTLDYPGAINTFPMRIKGGLIVGFYDPGDGSAHGFLYTFNRPPVVEDLYLHGVAPALTLDNGAPTGTTPKYKDSPSVNRTAFKEIGTWAYTVPSGMFLQSVEDLRVWVGLKNSDDQGTYFDLRAELLKNGTPIASGDVTNVQGATRNPDKAKEVVVVLGAISDGGFDSGDGLSLRILTKVTATGGHNSAVGLRLYYDSVSRPSQFEASSGQ